MTKIRVKEALSVNEGHGSIYNIIATSLTCYRSLLSVSDKLSRDWE